MNDFLEMRLCGGKSQEKLDFERAIGTQNSSIYLQLSEEGEMLLILSSLMVVSGLQKRKR